MTGWDYQRIAGMTFPQLRCVMVKGREPDVMTDAGDIREWIRKVASGETR